MRQPSTFSHEGCGFKRALCVERGDTRPFSHPCSWHIQLARGAANSPREPQGLKVEDASSPAAGVSRLPPTMLCGFCDVVGCSPNAADPRSGSCCYPNTSWVEGSAVAEQVERNCEQLACEGDDRGLFPAPARHSSAPVLERLCCVAFDGEQRVGCLDEHRPDFATSLFRDSSVLDPLATRPDAGGQADIADEFPRVGEPVDPVNRRHHRLRGQGANARDGLELRDSLIGLGSNRQLGLERGDRCGRGGDGEPALCRS
jgi:hypothetical protein